MKNIVFDLGGVVFARDVQKCTPDFIRFFDFVRAPEMPGFWEEYDRGTRSLDETKEAMCSIRGCTREKCDAYVQQAIALQEPVKPTERLLGDLKSAGYKLMSSPICRRSSSPFSAVSRSTDISTAR